MFALVATPLFVSVFAALALALTVQRSLLPTVVVVSTPSCRHPHQVATPESALPHQFAAAAKEQSTNGNGGFERFEAAGSPEPMKQETPLGRWDFSCACEVWKEPV